MSSYFCVKKISAIMPRQNAMMVIITIVIHEAPRAGGADADAFVCIDSNGKGVGRTAAGISPPDPRRGRGLAPAIGCRA